MSSQSTKPTTVPVHEEDLKIPLYPPSFIDRLMAAVDRLPMPYWVTYLLGFFLQAMLFHILAWADGWVPAYSFDPILLVFPLWLWGPLAIVTYLDRISLEALSDFSPLLTIHRETMERLKYTLTTMPAGMVIINGTIWTVFYFIVTYLGFDAFYVANDIGPLYTVAGIILGIPSFFIGSVIFYHSVRQLILVNRIVKMVKEFDLFHLDPMYAFSRLTALTGISLVVMLSLTLIIFPLQLASGPILVMLLGQVALTLAAFVLPLWIVHQRLVIEKRGLLADVNRRVVAMLSQLHQNLDENEFGEVSGLNNAIAGLIVERDLINKIPTWPWRAGTLTSFLTAIFLPILLFLIQLVLGNWLGV